MQVEDKEPKHLFVMRLSRKLLQIVYHFCIVLLCTSKVFSFFPQGDIPASSLYTGKLFSRMCVLRKLREQLNRYELLRQSVCSDMAMENKRCRGYLWFNLVSPVGTKDKDIDPDDRELPQQSPLRGITAHGHGNMWEACPGLRSSQNSLIL